MTRMMTGGGTFSMQFAVYLPQKATYLHTATLTDRRRMHMTL